MADDEDDHDQQQDGRVVPVPGAALPTVDREEDADVEEDEKQQRHHAQEHQSVKRVIVIVDISVRCDHDDPDCRYIYCIRMDFPGNFATDHFYMLIILLVSFYSTLHI